MDVTHDLIGDAPRYITSNTSTRMVVDDPAPSVFIIDGDVAARESLESLIRSAGWQGTSFASAEDFLGHPPFTAPCCLILDVTLPGLNGLELQQRLVGRQDMPIIFVSSDTDVPIAVNAMKAGAVEFLIKPFNDAALLCVIGAALEQSRAAVRLHSDDRALQKRYLTLTSREREVMGLVVSGLTNKQVGDELGICEVTAKAHRWHLMHKMKADSLAHLVSIALRLGVLRASKR